MRRFILRDELGEISLQDEESVRQTFHDIELSFSADKPIEGCGKLIVTSRRIIWLGYDDKAYDFDVQYIILHAITHDPSSYPKPCLYCQLDCDEWEDMNDNDDDDKNDTDNNEVDNSQDMSSPSEMFIVPSDPQILQQLFDTFSNAAIENPDENDEFDSDLIYDLNEVQLGSEQASALAHLESVFVEPPEFRKNENEEK